MFKSSSYRSSKPGFSGPSAQGQEQVQDQAQEQAQDQEPFFAQKKEEAFFQPKLTIGQAGDHFEKEADSVADKVVSRKSMEDEPAIQRQEISGIQRQEISGIQRQDISAIQRQETGSIQRLATPLEDENFATNDQRMLRDRELREKPEVQLKCAHCEEEDHSSMVQRKPDQSARTAPDSVSSRIDSSRGKGSPLPSTTLAEMQSSFGHDFSNVNIHTDADSVNMSRDLGAQAFTQGSDIYFNTGKFNPESSTGKHLLAHELTHVVQQGASPGIQTKPHHGHASAPKPEPSKEPFINKVF
ncbi:MAG TPA: DUF4157 domain-containing protein [Puia sp.]|jgi:hypothetical protein